MAVNALFLEPGMGGLETYVKEVVPALRRLEPGVELTVLANPIGHELLVGLPGFAGVEVLAMPLLGRRGLRAVSELTLLGVRARRFDLVHSVAMTGPLATPATSVVVVADTTWLTVPDLRRGQAATMRLWQRVVPVVARRSDRVIAISEACARDVVEHLGVPRGRIDVVPLGFTPERRAAPTPEPQLRERLRLGPGPIVLNIAMKKRHKNIGRIVEAMVAVRRAVPGAQLVLPGAPSSGEQELREQARALGLADAVAFPGYVSEEDVEGLYAAASAFVFPSLNEGFGLPLLEAMGRGVPVVTSNVSALPEVAGDAALLVDPYAVDELAAATVRVLTDATLRARLVEAGAARAATFTWERTAAETLASWRTALAA